ncbi:unnamed protein product [Polarella glacialis]|uniref:PAS domain-containing protein n=1 Tax=Polarella glacialis TaxID=89957 RepID=A0A813GB61_POLGL|nr:unnamed protein product [Polarella glacialis]
MPGSFSRSGAGVKGSLPSWACKLLHDSLSTQGCFSIGDVDVTDEGYTIRYASPGFRDLFECESSDVLGRRCCNFAGYNCAARSLIPVAKALGMDLQEAKTRVQFALKYLVQQGMKYRGTWDKCEIVLSSRTELRTIWGYTVKLLEAACPGGGFDQLVQEHKLGLLRRLSSAGINSRSAVLCFQQKALDVWTGKLIDKARETAANAHSSCPAWEYRFMLDHLSTQQSFILADCDVTTEGVTLRYASPGCCDLFELNAPELGITRCQNLVGYQCVSRHVGALAASVGMDVKQVKERLRYVHDFLVVRLVAAAMRSWDNPSLHLGFALALSYKPIGGTFFVCEYNMLSRTEPQIGWPYFVGFHRDVTDEVPVKRLLEAACPGGGFEQLVQEKEQKLGRPTLFETMDMPAHMDSRALSYLDEKAFDVWTGTVKDALWTPSSDLDMACRFDLKQSPERLPNWAYALIQAGLSEQQSFTICDNDAHDEGLSILYASPGFCELFECSASEFLGTRSCCQSAARQTAIAVSDSLGMGIPEVEQRLEFMQKYFVKQAAEQAGFSLLLACKGSGAPFVRAVALMSRTEQITGWRYIALLQTDVTHQVGIGKLIEAACPSRGFEQLVHESKEGMLQLQQQQQQQQKQHQQQQEQERQQQLDDLASLGVRLSDTASPSQHEALERWTGQLMDVVWRKHFEAEKTPRAQRHRQAQLLHGSQLTKITDVSSSSTGSTASS